MLGILALMLLTGCPTGKPKTPRPSPSASATPSAAKVDVARAVTRSIARDLSMPGTVAAEGAVNLAAEGSGKVLELYVDMGDFVRKGEVLARIDSDDLQMQIKTARAPARRDPGRVVFVLARRLASGSRRRARGAQGQGGHGQCPPEV